ncbi:hypothetical protein Droror1_Dr00007350 [Drosera rotundifolia]
MGLRNVTPQTKTPSFPLHSRYTLVLLPLHFFPSSNTHSLFSSSPLLLFSITLSPISPMGKATRWLKSLFGVKPTTTKTLAATAAAGNARLCHNPSTIPPNITPAEAAWLQSFYSHSDQEQSKHAIAVAAATAAAADAAVAAAHAAAAVVRLTSHGRGTMFAGGREKWAAVKIQSTFRAFLARKARRALKGLVKLQALVRGYLVRKQAAATLNGMQALIRAQASVRAKRVQGIGIAENHSTNQSNLKRVNQSVELCDDNVSEVSSSVYSKRLSASFETRALNHIEEITKVVEVDTGRPGKWRSRRPNTTCSECGDEPSSYRSLPYPLPFQFPPHHHNPSNCHCCDQQWGWTVDECRYSTAQSTPRFTTSAVSSHPLAAAKNASTDNFLRNYPSYMANTQSFKAKLRSHSAPKQRPDTGVLARQRMSLNEMLMESRNSLSGTRMQRSCSHAQEKVSFKNAVMSKFDKSSEFVKEPALHRYYYYASRS